MKVLVSLMLVLAGVGLFAEEEVIERTIPFADGVRIDLSNINGKVTIEAWDGDDVSIHAVKRSKGSWWPGSSGSIDDVDVVIESDGGVLTVETVKLKKRVNNVNVTYTLKVPRELDLDLRTVNGPIKVNGMTGMLKARTTNGPIRAVGQSGSFEVRTTNGGVDVELVDHDGEALSAKTTNGSVDVRLPIDQFGMDLDASCTNGRVRVGVPVTLDGSVKRTRVKGAVNGGGVPAYFRTTNGSISIDSLGG